MASAEQGVERNGIRAGVEIEPVCQWLIGDGSECERHITHACGHPQMPLDKAAREAQFAFCCALVQPSIPEDDGRSVAAFSVSIDALERAEDCQPLLARMG